jgi:pimeloyl-ACP methyl ester carboxylesterase
VGKIMPVLKSQYAEVNGIRLHFVSSGQGRLIMFVHGFPEFWFAWKNQLMEFGRDHQAIAPDMRGYNLSAKPAGTEKYHIKDLVEDLRALVEHLGHEKCIMVAHDWGGAVAWSMAMRHPEWLDRLIIINSPHPAVFARQLLINSDQQKASRYMLMFRSAEAERILSDDNYKGLMDVLSQFGSKWEMTAEIRQKYVEAWSQPGALTASLNYYRASPLYPPTSREDEVRIRSILNLRPEMLEVKVPTLVIWGELDRALLTGNLDGLAEYVDDLTVERISEGTHWVIHERSEQINFLIRDFIS